MGQGKFLMQCFNRGRISDLALARTDLERTALSSTIQDNWMPRVLGSQMLRPGWRFVDKSRNNAYTVRLPFIYSIAEQAKIEMSDSVMRVRIGDNILSRIAVASQTANGNFDTDVSGWDAANDTGCDSGWQAGGFMYLRGTKLLAAKRRQLVAVSAGDQASEHALRIVVNRGFVVLRVGTTAGGNDIFRETTLSAGTHSIAFIPNGSFYIELSSLTQYNTLVDSCTVEASGAMEIPTPYLQANLDYIRKEQSNDVVYLACKGLRQRKIERRAPRAGTALISRSWSLVDYQPSDGPFKVINASNITLQPSDIIGDITITASRPFFQPGHVGALFQIASTGQVVKIAATAAGQYSNPIRVTGVNASRNVTVTITGTWVGNVQVQKSVGSIGSWTDHRDFTVNGSTTFNDGLDNQIVYYRVGLSSYTSGEADVTMSYSSGSISGVAKVTGYTSPTVVSAAVLTDLGNTDASLLWYEGEWSDVSGYPSAVGLDESRLGWAGNGRYTASSSDSFETFSPDLTGDSAPIQKNIGAGAVAIINSMIAARRVCLFGETAEYVVGSNSFDAKISPDNANIKSPSTQGSAPVAAAKLDNMALFVEKSGTRLYQISYSIDKDDFQSVDLTQLVPEITAPGIVRIAVQRKPDTRIHCVLADGTVAILVFDDLENVKCFVTASTQGFVEDVIVMPAALEDEVSYTVRRTVNGQTVRYFETWALESECKGATLNKQADSFIIYNGVPTTVLNVPHLEGMSVVVWGDGRDQTFNPLTGADALVTVSGGKITIPAAVSNAIIGLQYKSSFRSVKLAYAAEQGTALLQKKKVPRIGVILKDTHARGLRYGHRLDDLEGMPGTEDGGAPVDPHKIWSSYDKEMFEFNGDWSTDSRVCFQGQAPRCCTILALVMDIEENG